jgi:hypothetical protein
VYPQRFLLLDNSFSVTSKTKSILDDFNTPIAYFQVSSFKRISATMSSLPPLAHK